MGPFSASDPQIEPIIKAWLSERAELFVERYLPHSGGSGDYLVICSVDDLHHLIERAEPNAVIFIAKQNMLPLRGVVDEEFICCAIEKIPDGKWWVIVMPVSYPDHFTNIESGDTVTELQTSLHKFKGQLVWVGLDFAFPDLYWEPDDAPDTLILRKPEEAFTNQ